MCRASEITSPMAPTRDAAPLQRRGIAFCGRRSDVFYSANCGCPRISTPSPSRRPVQPSRRFYDSLLAVSRVTGQLSANDFLNLHHNQLNSCASRPTLGIHSGFYQTIHRDGGNPLRFG